MQSASDGLSLLGFLFLFAAVLAAIFLYVPWPARSRRRPPAAPVALQKRTLDRWVELADMAEGYAPGHARRVADLARALAEAVGLPTPLLAPLALAGLLHDVGEVDFEPELLGRAGPLGREELQRVWLHTTLGAALAREITGETAVGQWVRWHHERWDGLGYPDGLCGEAIPLPARILRLADSADALLHDRPYRPARSREQVVAELTRLAGISFDPALVQPFLEVVLPRHLETLTAPAEPPAALQFPEAAGEAT